MSYMITTLETKNSEALLFWIGIFVILAVGRIVRSLFSDSIHARFYHDVISGLSRECLRKYISLDNTKIESYGTGKM